MSTPLILVINLGGTSSKFAIFDGPKSRAESSLAVPDELVKQSLAEQRPARVQQLRDFLKQQGVEFKDISAVAARGGLMKPLSRRGVFRVDEAMRNDLATEAYGSHPANLSSLIAHDLCEAEGLEIPLFVVDPITVDTIWDEARISGVPGIERVGRLHALNIFRAVRNAAEQLDKPIHRTNFVVGHFGSGFSICTIVGGRCVDVNDAQLGEGPFSVSRAGTLPIRGVMKLAYAEPDPKKLKLKLSRESGLLAYTGTADFREIEKRLDDGDPVARQAYRAMVYQSVKYLASYAGVLDKAPDAFILTGGMLNSKRFATDLTAKLKWMAPVIVLAGEDEMEALAEGVDRALAGYEPVIDYTEIEPPMEAPPRSLDAVVKRSAAAADCRFVVVGGDHPEIPETIFHCHEAGISGFTLFGPVDVMKKQLEEKGVDLKTVELVESSDVVGDALARIAADPNAVLVKGKCDTKALFKAVLAALPDGDERPFLSHVAFLQNNITGKLVAISDGGLVPAPDKELKIRIMQNAANAMRALGVRRPYVALIAGMEDKGQDFPAIVDAREIVAEHKAGRWSDCIIEGPYGIDVALDNEAAAIKGIKSQIAGLTDVIVTPNLESCNVGIKLATATSGEPWAGLVVGGPVPMVVGSRSDDAKTRLSSIAMSQLVAAGMVKLRKQKESAAANG